MGAGIDVRLTPGVQLFVEGARSPHLNYVFRREAAFPRIRRSRAGFGLRIDILQARDRRYARRHFGATPAEVRADHRPAAAIVHIESAGIKWRARSDAAWISLDSWFGRGDARITVGIQENPSLHARTGVVRVTGGGRTETVRFHQAGRPPPPPPPAPRLDVSPVRFNVTVTAGTERVRVSANAPWDAVAPAGWLTVDIDSTGFGIRYAENESLLPRTGFVTVSTSDLVRTIEIVQSGRTPFDEPLDLAPQWLDISSTARTDTVRVHPFGAEWSPVSAVSWLSVEPINEGMIVRSEANDDFEPRIGMIEVVSRGSGRIVVVTQAAAPLPPVVLRVEPARLALPSAAGVDTLGVRSSESDWTVSSDARWLTLERTDTTVVVRSDENATFGSRLTVITVAARDMNRSVIVRQSGQRRPDPIRPDLRIDVTDTRDCVLIRLIPVLFERNSTELTPAARENLTVNVNMLRDCPSRNVEIDVALDPDEDDAALKRRERITAIRNFYLEQGIPEARLVDGLDESGERRPE
ncbi:MAG: hypothetical protein HKN17_08940 [Rhodothermales bacterium]|nr:hypothetical protein [Rhodothermales bacterium]